MRKSADGRPSFGFHSAPVGAIERNAFELRKPMGGKAGWFARRFGFKHFQYMGAVSDQLIVGCAIADAGLVTNVFAYVFNPQTRQMQKCGWQALLGKGFSYNPDPDNGVSQFSGRQGSVTMTAQRNPETDLQTKTLQVDMTSGMFLEFSFDDGVPYEPMRICTQTGATGWTYAQKVAGVPARGVVRSELGDYRLEDVGAYAHHDFTAGYLRRETYWHWACLSGRAESGEELGLNLSCGVNETAFTENCIWCDGRLIKVDTVLFDFDGDDLDKPWVITSCDDKVSLTFTPMGAYRARTNALVAATNFHQLFGRFEGVIRCADRDIRIKDMYGFAERQYLKW